MVLISHPTYKKYNSFCMKALIMTAFNPETFKGGMERLTIHMEELLKGEGYQVSILHKDNVKPIGDYFPYWIGRYASNSEHYYDIAISNGLYGLGFFPDRRRVGRFVAWFSMLYLEFSEVMKIYEGFEDYLGNKYLNGFVGEVFVAEAADFLVAVSESVKEEIKRYIGVDKDIEVVHNPVDDTFKVMEKAKLRSYFNIPKDAFVGLFVGRNDRTKGYDVFKEVVSYTYKDVFWIQVMSSGGFNSIPMLKDITTFEDVPFEKMPTIYNLADFLFFPSRYEGFGLSIVEALSCGLPVITGKVGIAKELEDVLNGLTMESINAKEALEKIKVLKKYKSLREYHRLYVPQEIQRRFSIDSWKGKMKKVLSWS